ncbi:hypothetical protein H4R19_002172 [Coemansia spiralis]|nr:hypothetical protein H4R19_002172 [Coemansia spiralis]
MYASVHDQPPHPSLLPHPVTFTTSAAASVSATALPLPSTFFVPPSPHQNQHQNQHQQLAFSLPPTRPLSRPAALQKPSRAATHTSPARSLRRTVVNAQMQRGPYSREATDISDQELRQILESENISGLPAPYCLVPHYDGQMLLPQNTLWQQPPTPLAAASRGGSTAGPGGQRPVSASSSTGGEPARRRTRTTLTPYQLRVLFRVWERTQYPSSDLRFRLATNLMMTPRNVQIWFQNQRQKTKERAEMRRRTHSPSGSTAPAAGIAGAQRHAARPHQQQPLASPAARAADTYIYGGYPGPSGVSGMPPLESPFHYTHGPPPPPPAIPPPPPSAHSHPTAFSLPPHQGPHMSSPPTLYPYAFSQPLARLPGHISTSYAHAHPPHPTQCSPTQPLSPRAHDIVLLHHQRHASQPQILRLGGPNASSAMPPPGERSAGAQPPHTPLHAAPARTLPSPLVLGSRNISPVMTPSLSSLNLDSPTAATGAAPHTAPESPVNRRVQLAEILNPAPPEPPAAAEPELGASQLGPLPSLETVLAGTATDTCAPASSAAPDAAGPPATATASDKWRPW